MSYAGNIAIIPFGKGGLLTDAPNTHILPLNLIQADNATLVNDLLEKDFGSLRWHTTALPAGVVNFRDWWPDDATQRIIAVCRDGKIYRFTNTTAYTEIPSFLGDPATLNVSNFTTLLAAGSESQGRYRKLFILTGNSPIQIIEGDATTRRTIENPAADWTGNQQPFGGFVHRSRLFLFGNRNNPHGVYASPTDDHENFLDFTTLLFQVYPGESERIIAGFVYGNKAYVVKYPRGLYVLDDTDVSSANWFFKKTLAPFGGASPNGVTFAFDDMLIANNYGGITSLRAADTSLDLASTDIFNILRVQNTVRSELSREAGPERFAIYFEDKKQALFTYRSNGSMLNDRIAMISFKEQLSPSLTWSKKDQPNCLGLIKDVYGVDRPAYGSEDGFVYVMDQENRWVGDETTVQTGYSIEAMTAHMDLRSIDPNSASAAKRFDFLELVYQATGDFDVICDVYIDGRPYGTPLRFRLSGGAEMPSFRLDETLTDGQVPRYRRLPLAGEGRTIALRFRQEEENVGESVEMIEARIYYRLSGQEQKRGA
jgi:hypothetical protein